jgi:hypothetical protein
MMGHREPMIDGDEMDALTRWKKYIHFKPGERKRIKRKFNRRVRQSGRKALMSNEGYTQG